MARREQLAAGSGSLPSSRLPASVAESRVGAACCSSTRGFVLVVGRVFRLELGEAERRVDGRRGDRRRALALCAGRRQQRQRQQRQQERRRPAVTRTARRRVGSTRGGEYGCRCPRVGRMGDVRRGGERGAVRRRHPRVYFCGQPAF